ncbi:MAG: hypothetical protein EBS06_02850 [Proteobacteria bacterium]|nr:hypothetical protein [Pseudomonadota bacterium]
MTKESPTKKSGPTEIKSKKKYRFICVVDSAKKTDDEGNLSDLDVSPGYLHIHIVDSEVLDPIEKFSKKLSKESLNKYLFQWGIPLEKDAKTRSRKVLASEVKEFGQVGIGSLARGENEQKKDFIGGGEAFLCDSKNLRITKGNSLFEVADNEGYWTFQVCDFNGSKKISHLKDQSINGRDSLMNLLTEISEGKPCMSIFDAEFNGNFFARSNGIFLEDKSLVKDSSISLFDNEAVGGHLVGGSSNEGDLKSLQERFNQSK